MAQVQQHQFQAHQQLTLVVEVVVETNQVIQEQVSEVQEAQVVVDKVEIEHQQLLQE